jgi:hypothetical protein
VERPERPSGFEDTRPGEDLSLDGGRVKTAEELRRELEKNMDDCARLAESAQRERCEGRAIQRYIQQQR